LPKLLVAEAFFAVDLEGPGGFPKSFFRSFVFLKFSNLFLARFILFAGIMHQMPDTEAEALTAEDMDQIGDILTSDVLPRGTCLQCTLENENSEPSSVAADGVRARGNRRGLKNVEDESSDDEDGAQKILEEIRVNLPSLFPFPFPLPSSSFFSGCG
jgi:hypothetical protein